MIIATVLFALGILITVVIAACSATRNWSRLALGVLGILCGVGIIMLSGRTVGLVWLVMGATWLVSQLVTSGTWRTQPLAFRTGWQRQVLWALCLALGLVALLQWEPVPQGLPLNIVPLEIAETVGIAFAHHTWAIVGSTLLGVVSLACRDTERGR